MKAVEAWSIAEQEKKAKRNERKKKTPNVKRAASAGQFTLEKGQVVSKVLQAENPDISAPTMSRILGRLDGKFRSRMGKIVDRTEAQQAVDAWREQQARQDQKRYVPFVIPEGHVQRASVFQTYADVPKETLLGLLKGVPSINGGNHGYFVDEDATQKAVDTWRSEKREGKNKPKEAKPKKVRKSRRTFVVKTGYVHTSVIAAEFPDIKHTPLSELLSSVPGSKWRFEWKICTWKNSTY